MILYIPTKTNLDELSAIAEHFLSTHPLPQGPMGTWYNTFQEWAEQEYELRLSRRHISSALTHLGYARTTIKGKPQWIKT